VNTGMINERSSSTPTNRNEDASKLPGARARKSLVRVFLNGAELTEAVARVCGD
jgi:hypothetical protein